MGIIIKNGKYKCKYNYFIVKYIKITYSIMYYIIKLLVF